MANQLTQQQVDYIVFLRLMERAGAYGGRLSVTKKFFARISGRFWQTANTRRLNELVKANYLQSVVGGNNTVFYSLGINGLWLADKLIEGSQEFAWSVYQPELQGIGDGSETTSSQRVSAIRSTGW